MMILFFRRRFSPPNHSGNHKAANARVFVRGPVPAGAFPLLLSLVAAISLAGCRRDSTELRPAEALFIEAQDALAAGDNDLALKKLTESIERQPDEWVYFERARLNAELGNDDPAKADCEAGLALNPENPDLKWLQKELTKSSGGRFKGQNARPPRTAK